MNSNSKFLVCFPGLLFPVGLAFVCKALTANLRTESTFTLVLSSTPCRSRSTFSLSKHTNGPEADTVVLTRQGLLYTAEGAAPSFCRKVFAVISGKELGIQDADL